MTLEVQVFDNLKVKEENGQILFDAETAAIGLGLTQVKSGKTYVRWTTLTKYLSQEVGKGDFITEPQFYKLAIKANNETAEKFQDWVTSEVLPAIRKTGSYATQPQLPTNPHDVIQVLLEASKDDHKTLVQVADRVTNLEENAPLSTGEYNHISKRINQRVSQAAKDFGGKLTAKQRGELFKDINGGVKMIAGIDTRTQLRNRHYKAVVEFINDWEPSTATKTVIRQMSLDLETA